MMAAEIQNVRVNMREWNHENPFSLHWEQSGARFHVWCDAKHKPVTEFYKNPPQGVERYQPGYFDTRRLQCAAAKNAPMIAAATAIADRDNLWQLAFDAVKAEKLRENVRRIRGAISSTQHAASVGLLETLQAIVRAAETAEDLEPHLAAGKALLASLRPQEEQLAHWRELYGQEAVDAALSEDQP